MAVTKLTMSGFTPSTFNKYDDFLAGNAAYDPAATFLITRTTLSSDTATVTFSSIPSTYKHLQLRVLAKDTVGNGNVQSIILQLNSDTGSNYAWHRIEGDGSSVSASGASAQTYGLISDCSIGNSGTTSIFGASIIDIHDYASTSKAKTIRAIGGVDKNGSGAISPASSLWTSTSAVTSVKLTAGNTSFLSGSTFALYGFTG